MGSWVLFSMFCVDVVDSATVFVSGSIVWALFFFRLTAILRSALSPSTSRRRFTPAPPSSTSSIGMAISIANGAGLLGFFLVVAFGEGFVVFPPLEGSC